MDEQRMSLAFKIAEKAVEVGVWNTRTAIDYLGLAQEANWTLENMQKALTNLEAKAKETEE